MTETQTFSTTISNGNGNGASQPITVDVNVPAVSDGWGDTLPQLNREVGVCTRCSVAGSFSIVTSKCGTWHWQASCKAASRLLLAALPFLLPPSLRPSLC